MLGSGKKIELTIRIPEGNEIPIKAAPNSAPLSLSQPNNQDASLEKETIEVDWYDALRHKIVENLGRSLPETISAYLIALLNVWGSGDSTEAITSMSRFMLQPFKAEFETESTNLDEIDLQLDKYDAVLTSQKKQLQEVTELAFANFKSTLAEEKNSSRELKQFTINQQKENALSVSNDIYDNVAITLTIQQKLLNQKAKITEKWNFLKDNVMVQRLLTKIGNENHIIWIPQLSDDEDNEYTPTEVLSPASVGHLERDFIDSGADDSGNDDTDNDEVVAAVQNPSSFWSRSTSPVFISPVDDKSSSPSLSPKRLCNS